MVTFLNRRNIKMNQETRIIDQDYVIYRLEKAGATLLSLPNSSIEEKLRKNSLALIKGVIETYQWHASYIRPPVPSDEEIIKMEEAFDWISLIPQDRHMLRRVVGARSLVHPVTDRHLFPWRRLAKMLMAEHKSIIRWHAAGISIIVSSLQK